MSLKIVQKSQNIVNKQDKNGLISGMLRGIICTMGFFPPKAAARKSSSPVGMGAPAQFRLGNMERRNRGGQGWVTMNDQTAKADAGKSRLTLVPPEIIRCIARVREYAVTGKYHDPDNWKRVEPERFWDAALRHILAAWNDYRAVDNETGLLHISHAACNIAFLLQIMEENEDASI